ncbi:hypothetical protein [Methylobacterium variabile]|jgi:hypothetical protein|uniref:hypothetical protein n=1 Tax=Methylobacterium variabile TaxID=298794 RepID=UPI000A450695|nr:hypothetical protein [Methylobacterium variabile]
MADAALLDLIHHLTWQPPALMAPAPANMGGSAAVKAYEAFLTKNEADAAEWKRKGIAVREALWKSIVSGDEGLTIDDLSEIIARYEKNLRREARIVERLKRSASRELKEATTKDRALVGRLNGRLLALVEDYYNDSQDLALFLRAARAEINPEARGGPNFDNPDDLEAYLLSAVA